jgi:hypothetical protein
LTFATARAENEIASLDIGALAPIPIGRDETPIGFLIV